MKNTVICNRCEGIFVDFGEETEENVGIPHLIKIVEHAEYVTNRQTNRIQEELTIFIYTPSYVLRENDQVINACPKCLTDYYLCDVEE